MRHFPRCEKPVDLNTLISALYTLPASQVAEICGTGLKTVEEWKNGTQAVPFAILQLLRFCALGVIPDGFGVWSGWQLTADRFGPAGEKGNARWEEILCIQDYRTDRSLTEKQADLIEALTRQRDFYKRQCSLEARTGLMLANINETPKG